MNKQMVWRCSAYSLGGSRCQSGSVDSMKYMSPLFAHFCIDHMQELEDFYAVKFLNRQPDVAYRYETVNAPLGTRPESCVYFFQRNDGRIKIGYSKDVETRRKDLESGAGPLDVLALIEGGSVEEHELHGRFANSRVHGEWFDPAPELLDYITHLNTDLINIYGLQPADLTGKFDVV